MKRESLNKKGQNLPIGTIIVIILGVAVLVFLIIGFSQGFDTFFGKFDLAPSDLEATAQACQLYVQGSSKIDYCTYRDVKDKIYVNCQSENIRTFYPEETAWPDVNCDELNPPALFCESNNLKDSVQVNGDKCLDLKATLGDKPDNNLDN